MEEIVFREIFKEIQVYIKQKTWIFDGYNQQDTSIHQNQY